jgi:hypothetical protein
MKRSNPSTDAGAGEMNCITSSVESIASSAGALKKIGAVPEGILRKSLLRNGEYLDQALWTIIEEDWRANRIAPGIRVH